MNNKTKIEQLQAEIDLLKKQEQDKLISKVAPKYVGKFFTCTSSCYMHITEVKNASTDLSAISVLANEINIKPLGVSFDFNNYATVNTEYLQEITESEFKRIALIETSKIIEQL